MKAFSLLSILGVASLAAAQASNTTVTGKLGDARQVKNNPVIGEVWVAEFNGTVKGTVTGVAAKIGIDWAIDLTGLAEEKGPYKYHVHLRAVPESGNCTETLGHLDSYVRGDSPPCDASQPQTCEVGDLSGKYGLVNGPAVKKNFTDLYTATNIIQLGYVGNRGIVFHNGSGARIACATLKKAVTP